MYLIFLKLKEFLRQEKQPPKFQKQSEKINICASMILKWKELSHKGRMFEE